MTYAVHGERVFALQDPKYPDCTPPKIKRSDHRLKAYHSIYDERTWDLSEEIQYRALYDLVSGSQTCLIGAGSCHKYVPLEDLINILMSEKDALIKRLEEELQRCCKGPSGDSAKDQEDKNAGYGQDDKIAALTDELNNSREMLRKAMHKLQNIDEIVNENKTLQCKLRCSEERIKYLEEKKKCLESELEGLRSKSQIQMDLERAQEMLQEVTQQKEPCSGKAVDTLTSERDKLQEKVKELEKELEESKKKEAEIQMLRQGSPGLDEEEISLENECYRKKLASMRCLEKQIQELKKHGRALADKYKREAQKAAEQMNRMCQIAKELQALREERDSLRNRVKELSSYEGQYNALQRKLRCVEEVIAENEVLHSKMVALENLEKENEYLRCRLNRIQEMENTAAEDKERIMQLQCAVADQEEEMKDLLCQIERLTSGTHQEELERLRCELYEKSSKLKLCEEQLAEIPMLEAEIDELRTKLQTCCREFPEKKTGKSSCQKIEVRLPAAKTGICAKYKLQGQKSSSVIKRRCDEKFGGEREPSCSQALSRSATSVPCQQGEAMTCEEVQNLLQSSKGIISCVLEDMVEHQKEMEELEKSNKALKSEIETLKAKVGTDTGGQECELRKALEEAQAEIRRLKETGGSSGEDVELLKELNSQMKAELQAACEGLKQVSFLEQKLEAERKARCKAERQKLKGIKEEPGVLEPEDANSDYCKTLQKEVDDLKLQIIELKKLTDELKKENELLRELQKPCPDFSKELDEKCALENLLSLLQAELDAFKGQKLSQECEALRNELKRVMEQNCQLKALVDCYRQRLDLEKKSKELDGQLLTGAEEKSDRSKSPTVTMASEESKSGRVGFSQDISGREKSPSTPQKTLSQEKEKSPTTPQKALSQEKEKSPTTPQISLSQEKEKSPSILRKTEPEQRNVGQSSGAQTEAGKSDAEKLCEDELQSLRQALAEKENKLKAKEEELKAAKEEAQAAKEEAKAAKEEAQAAKEEAKTANEEAKAAKEDSKKAPKADVDECAEFKDRLKQMEAENAEKLKALMDQHQKELANRDKAYNDNLNAMKAGYEADIKKLADRHKQSVMKLQGLHEDEIQELNTTYESQMEMMQTQSEAAMNDVAKGSASKLKKLSDQYAKELQEKDKELNKLQDGLTKSQRELETLKRKLGNKGSTDSQTKHARELNAMKRGSQRKLSILKEKFDEEKKKSEAELESLKKKLKGKVCDCKRRKDKKPRDPCAPLNFIDVIEKILEKGLEALTFNEIALVHRKACCALEEIVLNSDVVPCLEPAVGDCCPHTPLLEADRQQLLQRIFALQKDIQEKQRRTQETIINMEVAIKKERCRLLELKNLLIDEQQKNSELKLIIQSQSQIQTNLKKERDELGNQASLHQSISVEKSRQLDQEKQGKKSLEEEVDRLKMQVKKLCFALEMSKTDPACQQNDQIEMMRIKLEQAQNQERKLAFQLENEAKCRMQLQCQVQALRQSFKQMVKLPAVESQIRVPQNPLDAKSAKEMKNLDQIKEKKNRTKSTKKQKK